MSEGDVSLIQDEDVLRKMWQQTEDLGKRKEIRAHMYKLREERLKTLYSEPTQTDGKSLQFTSSGGHTDSFADQCFQSLKSKEVRDSESPTRDYNFKLQDADNSTAGWTVVSSDEKCDDGKTQIKTTSAHTSGTYDADGGTTSFSGLNESQKKVTKHEDDNSKYFNAENVSNTMTKEQFVSDADNEKITRSATSSAGSTHVQSSYSQKYDSNTDNGRDDTDFITGVDNIQSSKIADVFKSSSESKNEKRSETTSSNIVKSSDGSSLVIDGTVVRLGDGELVSRKVEHPDEFTKVVIETRKLADGTTVTSTSREIKGSFTSKSGKQSSEHFDSATSTVTSTSERQASKALKSHVDNESKVIVTEDLAEKKIITTLCGDSNSCCNNRRFIDKSNQDSTKAISTNNVNTEFIETEKVQDVTKNDIIKDTSSKSPVDNTHVIEETNIITTDKFVNNDYVKNKSLKTEETDDLETRKVDKSNIRTHTDEIIEVDRSILNTEYPKPMVNDDAGDIIHNRKSTGEYVTTYQTDYTKKISEDLSPTHNAWASSLRSSTDSPLHGSSPSRGSIRGSRSSVSSIRSSISPDKKFDRDYSKKKNNEREPSPKKTNPSPTRISSENIYNKTGHRKSYDESQNTLPITTRDKKTPDRVPKNETLNKKYEILTDSKEEVCSLIDLNTDNEKKSSLAGNPYSSPRKSPARPNDGVSKNGYSPYASPAQSPERNYSSPTRTSPSKSSPRKEFSTQGSPETSPTRASPSTFDSKRISPKVYDKSPSVSPTRTPHKVSKYSPYSSNSSSPTRSMSPNKSYNEPARSVSPNKLSNEPSAKLKNSNKQTKNVLRSRDSSPTTSVSEIEFISAPNETVNKNDIPNASNTGTYKKESTRKSSLKKSSIQNSDNVISSEIKNEDTKKDDMTIEDSKTKVKPPFVRSETYEERCRKILGMPDKKTLVEGAEKNLSEILGILPNDKTSPKSAPKSEKYTERISSERELSSGIKSAELTRKPSDSEIPIYRKSSLKKSTDTQNQLINLVDAEFINLDTHGNIVSCGDSPNCNITDKNAYDKNSKITSDQFIKEELNEITNQKMKNVKKVEELSEREINIETLSNNKNDNYIDKNVSNKVKETTSPIKNEKTISAKKSLQNKTLSPERVPTKKPHNARTQSPDKKNLSCDRTSSPEKSTTQKTPLKKQPMVSKDTEKHITTKQDERLDLKTTKSKTTNDTISKKQEPSRNILTSQKYNIFKDDKSTKKVDEQLKVKDTVTNKKQITSQKVSDTKLLFNRKFEKEKSKTTLQNITDDKQTHETKKKTVELRKKFTDDSKPKDINVNKMQRSLTDTKTTTCISHTTDVKMTRTASDIVMKPSRAEPTRVKSKPEINITKITSVRNTTNTTYKTSPTNKSLNVKSTLGVKPTTPKMKTPVTNNISGGNVIIDLQRAKSSRETSPDHICPLPVYSTTDNEKPRLPDKVTEPDDVVNKKKIMHQTISETDTYTEGNIVELSDEENDMSKTHDLSQSDECLLSVTEKVSKFSNVDDTIKESTTKNDVNKKSHKKIITDKVEEKLTSDDCLLSVFDKVSKFSNVSDTKKVEDKQRFTEDFIRHEVDSDLENDECMLSVNNKVSHFIKTAEKVTEPIKLPESGTKTKKPDVTNTNIRSHKHEKTTNTTEKITSTEKSPGLVSKVSKMINDVKNVFDNDTTAVNDIKLTVQKETVASQAKKSTTDNKYVHIKSQVTPERTLPKTATTPEKIHPSPILKSTDTVKKAKALFENIANQTTETQDMSQKRSTKLTDIGVYKKSPTLDSVPDVVPKKEVNEYSYNVDTKLDNEKVDIKRDQKKYSDKYDKHTPIDSKTTNQTVKNKVSDATENYSKENKFNQTNTTTKYSTTTRTNEVIKDSEVHHTDEFVSTRRGSGKFGVELRRTSTDQTYNSERRRSSTSEPHLQPAIEDILDLTLLEQMLEKVTGYEQRRRIRTQIRVVKRNLENKPSCSPSKFETREISPTRRNKSTIVYEKTGSPVATKKTSTISVTDASMRSVSPDKKTKTYSPDRNRSTSPTKKSQKIENDNYKMNSNVKVEKKSEYTKTIDSEDHEHLSSPLRTKTSKVSEYTTAYLRRIGASNNLKSEYLPKVPNIRKEKEEIVDVEHHSSCTRKTSSVIEKSSTITSKRSDTESRHTTRSPSPKHSQSPTERIYVRTPSPDLKKPRQNEPKGTTEYHNAYSNIKTKISPKEPTNKLKQSDDDKPEWVKSNILRKTSTETKTLSHKKTEDKSKITRRAHSPTKTSRKPTDVITSSYGVGPTDENGKPLFGIKALRKSSNSSTNYEVKGTVITQQFRSENGGEPEGHVTLTAYSTDPADLKNIIDGSNQRDTKTASILNKAVQDKSRKGISSITTTTRYGGTTGNPISKIHKTSQPRAIEGITSSDHTTRRGSVKSLTEKFIKNAAETTKVEKSSYPKAGLILRTSSFRDNASGSISSRSSTPGVVRTDSNNSMNSTEMCTTTVERRKHSGTHTSFLDNRTKVTGVQDIITRMKNADIVIDDGDTAEDSEARSLLNKFLGATALMHGMSGYMDDKSQTKQFKQETRTVVSKTSTVLPDIDDIWDERILRKLLEDSDDYEERRKIRARLRQVMAEQEACAQIVADAVEESAGESVELEQHRHDDGESLPGDGLASLPEPLLRDVHGALARLQGALRTGPAPELLDLVARLQAGLLAQEPPPARAFRRRRRGNTRHTVGVTREELADARKYMQNIAFPADAANAAVKAVEPEEPRSSPYALLRQASFGSILSPTSFDRTNSVPQTPVKNATARPFTLNFPSPKADLPSPVDALAKLPRSPLQESIRLNKPDDTLSYFEAARVHQKRLPAMQTATVNPAHLQNGFGSPKPILKESVSLDSESDHPANETVAKIVQETLIKAAQKKICDYESSSESDDEGSDCSTVKMDDRNVESDSADPDRETPVIENNRIDQYYVPKRSPDPFVKQYDPTPNGVRPSREPPKNSYVENYSPFNNSRMNGYHEAENNLNSKQNKKLKMKRANTIDIPKPAHYRMESDDESDKRLSKFYPLDSINTEYKPKIPEFQPKTDNDRKFLAFIQKHDDNATGKGQNSLNGQQQRNGGCNWKSCFGSIKNVFESSTSDSANRPYDVNARSASVSSAKNFWKASEDPFHCAKPTNVASKPVKMTATRPAEQPKHQPKLPWTSETKGEVVTGSLTVSAPKMTNGVNDKIVKFIPKPAPVNQFSHAPMSAFKPLPKKSVPVNTKIWSPPSVLGNNKPFENVPKKRDEVVDKNVFTMNKPPIQKAPVVSATPWISNGSKENRVLNLAANKFEKSSPVTVSPQSPNIPPYKEKSFNPLPVQNGYAGKRLSLPQSLPAPGPLSAPNLVRKLENLKQEMNNKSGSEEEIATSKIDAERLQIEFYEKQIRENNRKYPKGTANAIAARRFSEHIPEDYTYTVTDYTPSIPVSTFIPVTEKTPEEDTKLESPKKVMDLYDSPDYKPIVQKPDIENTKLQPSKKLPDLVLNNKNEYQTKKSPVVTPEKSDTDDSRLYQNNSNYNNSEVHLKNKPVDNVKPSDKSDSLQQTEYKAVAKVMKGPVSQQAVIKAKSTQETYEKRDTAAKSLKGVLQKFSSPKLDVIKQMEKKKAFMQDAPNTKPSQPEPAAVPPKQKSAYEHSQNNHVQNGNDISVPIIKYNNVTSPKIYNGINNNIEMRDHGKVAIPHHRFKNKCSSEAIEISENGESIVSSKLQFPTLNKMKFASPVNVPESNTPSPTALSRSESWHQLAQQHAMKPPSPRISPGTKPSTRAKSMHLLALPKQFEAGISKDKIQEKKKTVEAYFSENISTVETKTTKRITKVSSEEIVTKAAKPVSPFAKFRQLDKQNSIQSTPSSPKTPLTPTGGGSPLFKFTDPQLQTSASFIKERLLQWCRDKTQEYENVKLDNFSTSWSDGLAFCALIHHFLPDEYDYSKLVAQQRRHNFTLAFKVADEKAGIYPLLDVEDMVTMRKPDWKCVFTYVQAIHRRFKDQD